MPAKRVFSRLLFLLEPLLLVSLLLSWFFVNFIAVRSHQSSSFSRANFLTGINLHTYGLCICSRCGIISKQHHYDLDENLEKVYRMEGGRYHAEPVSLIYDDNNYYMFSYSRKYDHLVSYRVDRMDQVRVEEESLSEYALRKTDETGALVEEAFRMYLGERKSVTLQFHDRLIGIIYDKFGEDLDITRINDHSCEAKVDVQISPPFWSWLFMLCDDLRLTAPEELLEEYKTQLDKAIKKFD